MQQQHRRLTGKFRDLGLGIVPRLFGGITDQCRHPQTVFQWRVLTSELGGQRVQTFDAFSDPVEWLTPKQLNVSLFGRDFLRGR